MARGKAVAQVKRKYDDYEIIYRDPKTLKADPRNARTHTDKQIELIRNSIKAFGFNQPILLKADDLTIGAGHARTRGAIAAKMERVPTITLDHLSEEEWRAYEIADNHLATETAGAGWNVDILAMELKDLQALKFDIGPIGFDAIQLAGILETPINLAEHWGGMPSYNNEDQKPHKTLIVHFETQEAVDKFAGLVEQTITENTKSIWYPKVAIESYVDKRYVTEPETAKRRAK